MIRLKKRQEEAESKEREGNVADEMDAGEDSVDAKADGKESKDSAGGGGVKLLGIGGKKSRTGKKAGGGKRRTPGEIRMQKDIAELDGGDVANITFPNPNNLTSFEVRVTPDTGYWRGATYRFTFDVPPMYPHEPPKVHCHTKIYHPNINLQGKVCLNILREDWKPVLDINAVIYGLIYLFYEPNPEDPLNHEAAELFRNDIRQFERIVRRSLQGYSVGGEAFDRLV
eukprot:CAMPEP_0113935446 /NCGR_PEP_ID=MMETSP1339-20121228/2592_1 /TAXON_ID=94617 /ORGANISM="Fibrocapsa japonica" /LENGTH=226 /DNA_ID=CAMNT_0000937599 /DNA_START=60 /DNA_END=740 /DNA_ORIENTATION=+ /assembly_acc=CAM_ASM_000762